MSALHRQLSPRSPKGLHRTIPMWSRRCADGVLVSYSLYFRCGPGQAFFVPVTFPAGATRRDIAQRLRQERRAHAGWGQHPAATRTDRVEAAPANIPPVVDCPIPVTALVLDAMKQTGVDRMGDQISLF